MAASVTDQFMKVGAAGTATTLASPGHSVSGTTITVASTTNWPTDTGVVFAIRQVDSDGVLVAGTYTEWRGTVSGSTITNMTLEYGTDQVYPAGSTTQVYIPVSADRDNRIVDGILVEHDQDGTHGDITPTSVNTGAITATSITTSSITVSGTATSQGWTPLGDVPNTITYNGNRNYDIVFNGVDHTSTLSPGMKMQHTRTVAAPDQCADLESGSSQYFSKTSPTGLSFTDDFTCSAWVKLESYTAGGIIARRNADTEGWSFGVNSAGQIVLAALRIAGNNAVVSSYASLPLNKWVHVAASYDLSGTTAAVYFDGVEVTSLKTVTGTCTALVQGTTALVVGAQKSAGTEPFDGKIAQAAVFSSVLSAATIRSYASQGLSGSESTLVSAYSLDNSLNDLSATANNLTAQGGAVATATDSPFANAVSAGLLEYAEINSVAFSTNTTVNVRVPDTCMIPTSGGVSAVSYSTQSNPYGLPVFSNILGETLHLAAQSAITVEADITGATVTVYIPANRKVRIKASMNAAASATNSGAMRVKEGATRLTQIQLANTSTSITNFYADIAASPTAGSHTYKLSFLQGTGGTWAIANDTQTIGYIAVELV